MNPARHILIASLFTCLQTVHCPAQPAYVLDPTFNPAIRPTADPAAVQAVAVQSDGKVLVAGAVYGHVGETPHGGLVRLNPDGTLDSTFRPSEPSWKLDSYDANGYHTWAIPQICVQADGRTLFGLVNYRAGSTAAEYSFVRLNIDGSRDPKWRPWQTDFEESRAPQSFSPSPGGEALLSLLAGWNDLNSFLKLGANGLPDASFQPTVIGKLVAVQRDGRLLVADAVQRTNPSVEVGSLARLNPDGSLDSNFHPQSPADGNEVRSAIVQPNGNIVIAGAFNRFNDPRTNYVARLLPNGELDSDFPRELPAPGGRIASTPDGRRLLWFGECCDIGGYQVLVTVDRDGRDEHLTPLIAPPTEWPIDSISGERAPFRGPYEVLGVLPDDSLVVLGGRPNPATKGQSSLPYFLRITTDGGIDPTFFSALKFLNARPVWRGSAFDDTGHFTGTIGCLTGWKYRVEASADLKQWDTVATGTSAGESVPFSDTTPPGTARRFFRVVKE